MDGVFDGAGWGTIDLGAAVDLLVSVRAEEFAATSAGGTAEVLHVAPLRLRLDFTAQDGDDAIWVRGDASFRFVSEPTPCT